MDDHFALNQFTLAPITNDKTSRRLGIRKKDKKRSFQKSFYFVNLNKIDNDNVLSLERFHPLKY